MTQQGSGAAAYEGEIPILDLGPYFSGDMTALPCLAGCVSPVIDIIDGNKKLTIFGRKVIASDKSSQKKILNEKILELRKMTQLNVVMAKEHKSKANDLIELLPSDFFGGKEPATKKIYATKAVSWLKFKP